MAQGAHFLLSIHGKDLEDLDLVSHTDPYAILKRQNKEGEEWQLMGQTETIDNDLDPRFAKSFPIRYRGDEDNFLLKLDMYDRDSHSEDLSQQQHIGSCTIPIKEVDNETVIWSQPTESTENDIEILFSCLYADSEFFRRSSEN